MKRRLPIGIQDFVSIREGGFLYVDKTDAIHRLLTGSGKTFFLSRPRRFGKSLLCSTLGAIFEGRRALFQEIAGQPALAIDALDWDWTPCPVIRLDLNAGNHEQGVEVVRAIIGGGLKANAARLGIALDDDILPNQFMRLIQESRAAYGERAAVLIDEYDKPLLATIDKQELHDQIRAELKGFYGVLKTSDPYLKFVLLTGVTKFSQVSVFSDLNHLVDLTLDARYADFCGITQEELEKNFAPEIEEVLCSSGQSREQYLEKLRCYYNGYRFSKKPVSVYNPFGILNHFDKAGEFSPYWYETGTPTFLIKRIKENNFDVPNLIDGVTATIDEILDSRIDRGSPIALLYQSGYLTIKDYDEKFAEYTLGFPNGEVKYAFLNNLLASYIPLGHDVRKLFALNFVKDLLKGDVDGFMTRFAALFESIPYDTKEPTEHFFQGMLLVLWTLLGQFVQAEAHTAKGRSDAVVVTGETVYVFEFKTTEGQPEKAVEDALQQIDEKRYCGPYLASGLKFLKTGVAYDVTKREVGLWKSAS